LTDPASMPSVTMPIRFGHATTVVAMP